MEPRSRADRLPPGQPAGEGKRSGKQRKRDKRRAKAASGAGPGPAGSGQARPGHAGPGRVHPGVAGLAGTAAASHAMAPLPIEILVVDRRWRRLVPQVEQLVRLAARAGGGAGSVVLDNDLRVRRLNARHRGRNKPTNVLTFETGAGLPGGDIVLALETVRREARAAGRLPRHHLAHLVVHGALHLRGHDHHGAGEARRMEMQEARILHRLGMPNPWKPMMAAARP